MEPVIRPGFGTTGQHISLLSNYFKVRLNDPVVDRYIISISTKDDRAVKSNKIGRKLLEKMYFSKLVEKRFAYDGKKYLYTVGPLPENVFEVTLELEESYATGERGSVDGDGSIVGEHSFGSEIYKVKLRHSAEITLKSKSLTLEEVESSNSTKESLKVLAIFLRQQAAKRGGRFVRRSFFFDDSRNPIDVARGLVALQGFQSNFRPTQGGLSLNIDLSTMTFLRPGPVIEYLKINQNVNDVHQINWAKGEKMLKNMRIKTTHNKKEYNITGLSEEPCSSLYFQRKLKNGNAFEGQTVETTVYEYFTLHYGITLTDSADLPCLDVGNPKRPTYLPLELCSLVSLQRNTDKLSSKQRRRVSRFRKKPEETKRILTDVVRSNQYDQDPVLSSLGISIETQLTEVDGRVLDPPRLMAGNSWTIFPERGQWSFSKTKLLHPKEIKSWLVVNFSTRFDISRISTELISCAEEMGIKMEHPLALIEEDSQFVRVCAAARVEAMFKQIKSEVRSISKVEDFILCVLPVKKNSDIYGPWKKKCLCDIGIVTQCICPTKINDQYLTSVLLKINSKLGGINSLLEIECFPKIPLRKDPPTWILGMDVSHGSRDRSDDPSIAAVVGSLQWPLISRYRASVRTQSQGVEIIDALYKPLANGTDDGIIRELLADFYKSSNRRNPERIIVFRDGVGESQFSQVLNIELKQITKACQHWLKDNVPVPKFTVIVAQKNHHTKFFRTSGSENIPPGTVVDTEIVHPRNYDFYMCAHEGRIGTSRPVHYQVLHDEIGFSPDELQNLVHRFSYAYQRGTNATSLVAPIWYAHHAAYQMGQILKSEKLSETASAQMTSPELPRLDEKVAGSMFFC